VPSTEVILVTGERYEVSGAAETVEAAIVAASRGSIMQLAWLTELGSGWSIAVNPSHVAAIRSELGPGEPGPSQPASAPS
jgi:hypothetical protein